jgi:hypothetical protein
MIYRLYMRSVSRFYVILVGLTLGTAPVSLIHAQQVFELDFEDQFLPSGWEYGQYAEWGRLLGDGGGNFFRFHPVAWMDALTSPELQLDEGEYILYYAWNEASANNPDFCQLRLLVPGSGWQDLDRIGQGNDRTWQSDSTYLGLLETGTYQLAFHYQSTVRYPSQYLSLDNIMLYRRDAVTTANNETERPVIGLYPNPAAGHLHLQLAGLSDNEVMLNILDELGRVVLDAGQRPTDGNTRIDVSSLAPGIYLLVWKGHSQQGLNRFLIQR